VPLALAALVRVATVAVLTFLAAATATVVPERAIAGGSLIPTVVPSSYGRQDEAGSVGPALAGDHVIWARTARHGYDVVTQAIDGSTARHDRISAPTDGERAMSLTASPRRFALSIGIMRATVPSCKACTYITAYDALFTARVGTPPQLVHRCTEAKGCGPRCARTDTDVSEDVVIDSRCLETLTLRDYGTGATPPVKRYDACGGKLAGNVLAMNVPGRCEPTAETVVDNWRTGTRMYALKPPVGGFDVQADGKLAFPEFVSSSKTGVDWASPAEPFPHRIATIPYWSGTVFRFTNDLIAYAEPTFNPQGPTLGAIFEVRRLDGSIVAHTSDAGSPPRFDFDGRRLVWVTRPCELGAFVVWNLQGEPPAMPSGQCPAPHVAQRSVRIGDDRRLHFKLNCPREPALGCEGFISARAKRARHPHRLAYLASGYFKFPPGGVRQKALEIDHSLKVCASRHGLVRLRITARSYGRRGSSSPAKSSVASVWLRERTIHRVVCK